MPGLRNTYTVRFELISPIHIGSGGSFVPDEYIVEYDNNEDRYMLCRFDINDLFNQITSEEKKTLESKSNDMLGLRRYIQDLVQQYYRKGQLPWTYQMPVDEHFAQFFKDKLQDHHVHNEVNKLEVHEFIQNSFGQKYIPGSSIKGALSTALQDQYPQITTGTNGEYNDLMITDSEILQDMELFEVSQLYRCGQKSAIPTNYELLKWGASGTFHIKLTKKGKFTQEMLRSACNTYAKQQVNYALEYIKKRKNKYEKYNAEDQQDQKKWDAYNNLDRFFTKKIHYYQENLDENSFLLNLGFGSIGVFKMLSEDQGGKYEWKIPGKNAQNDLKVEGFPSTFWLADHMPLGWVKCTFLD